MSPIPTREQGLLITASLVLIAAVATSFALWWASSVAIPLVMALMVVYLVSPVVDTLQLRLKAPRWLAITAAFVIILLSGVLVSIIVVDSVSEVASNGAQYQASLTMVGDDLTAVQRQLSERTGIAALSPEQLHLRSVARNIEVSTLLSTVGMGATNVLGLVSTITTNATLVLVFAIILVAGRPPRAHHTGLWGEIDLSVQRYLGLKFLASLVTGALTWLLLWWLGVPLSMVFGLLAFILNFIPTFGSLIAMVLPLPIAYLTHSDQPAVWMGALLLPGSVQFVVGNLIEPYLQGDTLDLHPITVLLTLIFWALLWGAAGAFLAVPLTAVLKMVFARFETTRPVAELLAGRLPEGLGAEE